MLPGTAIATPDIGAPAPSTGSCAGRIRSNETGETHGRVAERAHAGKDYQAARRAAEQARASAELAEEKARLAKAKQARSELDDTLKALRGGAAARPVQ